MFEKSYIFKYFKSNQDVVSCYVDFLLQWKPLNAITDNVIIWLR